MLRLGLLGVVCLAVIGTALLETAPASAQSAAQPAARIRARPSAAPATHAPPREAASRAHRDLIVPPGFASPRSASASSSELIIPEIFRSDAPHREIRVPEAWERRRGGAPSELRVPAIFLVNREEAFDPRRIDDGLRVPEIFRQPPAPAAERVYRVRDELRAPGLTEVPIAPAVIENPPTRPAAAPSPGLGRRLDSPGRR